MRETKFVIYVAGTANLVIAIMKFAAAAVTGSSAMLSEGIHSVVDTGNELLLLLGAHRGRKPADAMHPYGYGKELYFWSLMVAMLLFGIGGGMAIVDGVTRLVHPRALEDPFWAYLVLAISALMEGTSWSFAFRRVWINRRGRGIWRTIRESYDPSVFTVLLEDSAALIGLSAAFLGIFLGHRLHNLYLDGVASVVIGVTLCVVGLLLIRESKGLLVGESARADVVESIGRIARADPAVVTVERVLTLVFGPDELLLNIDLQFQPSLTAAELAAAVRRLEQAIRVRHPAIKKIFIEAAGLTAGADATTARPLKLPTI